jgi:hypothetical protein
VATTMTRTTMVPINATYASGTGGQVIAGITPAVSGDLIPISSGSGALLMFRTTGTGSTITLLEVVPPQFGTGGNVVLTLGATDFQGIYIANDQMDRFDQGGANAQLLGLTYSSITGMTTYAVTIP